MPVRKRMVPGNWWQLGIVVTLFILARRLGVCNTLLTQGTTVGNMGFGGAGCNTVQVPGLCAPTLMQGGTVGGMRGVDGAG
eukprot:1160552-Pelagomonas_calceolata.AAC.4